MGITITGGIQFGSGYSVTSPPPFLDYMIVATGTSPYIAAYPWNSSTGFGTKFTDPASAVSAQQRGISSSPDGSVIAVSTGEAWKWSSSGFGTKYTNATTGGGLNSDFNTAGNAVAFSSTNSPFVYIYPWNNTTGFGTKFANPATLPGSTSYGVTFHPSDNAVAVSTSTSPYIAAYAWNNTTGFGTKFANPATTATDVGINISFNPTGAALAMAFIASPARIIYRWSSSGFGTTYTVGTTAGPTGWGVAFSSDNTAFGSSASGGVGRVSSWNDTTGLGTQNNITASSTVYTIAFSPDSKSFAVGYQASPWVSAYPWNNQTVGTVFTNPTTTPTGAVFGITFTRLTQ